FTCGLAGRLFEQPANHIIQAAIIVRRSRRSLQRDHGMKRTSHPRTKELARWDHTYLWHPFTQMKEWEQEEPIIIERGKGSYLTDTEGRRYLDGTSSIWVNLHGHQHPALDTALRQQLAKVAHSTLLGLSNPL